MGKSYNIWTYMALFSKNPDVFFAQEAKAFFRS